MRVRTLFFIFALAFGIKANATNYYFSTSDGDDSRSSSQAQNSSTPWKSIDKLNSFFKYLQPGDKVLFKSGDTFYGSIVTNKSGTSSDPITLSSYGSGPKPVISGLIRLSVWKDMGNGIYQSGELPIGKDLNMVLINGQEYAMGRYPNVSDGNGGYLNFESHGYKYINDNESPLSSDWVGAQVVVRANRFFMQRSSITEISGSTIRFNPSLHVDPILDKFGYFVQNSMKTLDQYGEWYYNADINRVYVYF